MNIRTQGKDVADAAKSGGFVPDYLLYLLAAASSAASDDFHAQVRAAGVRGAEWRVLASLCDEDGQMITQLAQIALMEQSRLTKIVDQMAAKGLVSRQSDPRDRRRVRIHLTEAGRLSGEALVAAARDHERSIVERLRPGEAALLKESLRNITLLFGSPRQGADREESA